jgi:bifunctional DNase/RNase
MTSYLKKGITAVLLVCTAFLSTHSAEKERPSAYVEMEVKGVGLDPTGQSPIVILADKDGSRVFPIWIGFLEASAIERELKNVATERPMTHDLLYSILGRVEARVKEVRIVELKGHTYHATLFLIFNKKVIEVDTRPSDAIIIALKSKAPIFLLARLLDQQGVSLSQKEAIGERNGIRVQELTSSLASQFNFKDRKGVLVAEVIAGSPSDASGIKSGDIITKVNLKEVGSIQEFEEAFDVAKGARSIRISVFRNNKSYEINLTPKP